MYLSQLLIDTGGNPDRQRPGRMWMGNIYHVHQRLCMAFGKKADKNDPALFLFRIDNLITADDSRAVILVQSELEPDWEYAFRNAPDFLADLPQNPDTREYNPVFHEGDILRFRLLANPTKKISTGKFAHEHETKVDRSGRKRTLGKRVSIGYLLKPLDETSEQRALRLVRVHEEWLAKRAASSGFSLCAFELQRLFRVTGSKPDEKADCRNGSWNLYRSRLTFNAALMEGVLEVTDTSLFAETLRKGVGTARSFGFGLLSVIRR